MSEQISKRRLQIVPKIYRSEIAQSDFQISGTGAQSNLFPTPRPGMLVFVYFPEVTEDEFRKALEFSKPSMVLELRTTPRFDIGQLNRKDVFRRFDQEHVMYFDLTSWARQHDGADLLDEIKGAIENNAVRFDRPIMLLLNTHDGPRDLSQQIIELVSSIRKSPPDVLTVPSFSPAEGLPR